MNVNTYIMYDGTCDAAMKFYEKAIGAKTEMKMTFADAPNTGQQCPPGMEGHILHARFSVAGTTLMCSDCPQGRYEKQAGFAITLSPKEPAEAERLFNALSEKATITMPLSETFWALRFGMLQDQFGIPWMINCEKPKQ